jgi:uncharacterized protein (TIGR00251 family)
MKGVESLQIRQTAAGAVLAVKVVPGSSRDRVVGALGESLKVATAAPPEKGKANAAVAAILAEALDLDARSVRLHAGPGSPRKEFLIAGLSADQVRRRLAALP